MAKMKIQDLAKELGRSSKEVMNLLADNRMEKPSVLAILNDDEIAFVKGKLPAVQREEAPKKKRPSFVFHPQNSTSGDVQNFKKAEKQSAAKPAAKPARPAAAKAEPVKEAPKAEAPAKKTISAAEAIVKNPAKPEVKVVVKAEAPKPEAPKAEAVKAEAPKAEAPKAEAPKTEAPKAQAVKAEPKENDGPRTITASEAIVRTTSAARPALKIIERPKPPVPAVPETTSEEKPAGRGDRPARNGDRPARNGDRPARNGDRPARRDGQGGFQNRDGQRRDGQGAPNREGGRRDGQGGFQNRDGQRRDGQGGFQNRDGQRRDGQGGFQNRDGQRRDGQGGNFQRKDGGAPQRGGQGGFQNRSSKPGSDLTPISAKNTQDRSKNFTKKTWEKDHKNYEQPKRQENTRNLSKGNKKGAPVPVVAEEPKEEEIKTLILPDKITIKELAEMMKQQPSALVKKLFLQGEMVTLNSEVDFDKAEEIAMEFNCICEHEVKVDILEELLKDIEDNEEDLVERPPVVCVMGHVDHGKTSLLDAIRNTHVTAREAGGITQHIGAYTVTCKDRPITFLDTPGHEAFTAMRLRGAKSTDIAILVVAADDGVMPQTVEAISHAKAAEVDIIVAINKIDKEGANLDRVKKELAEHDLIPEDWGGSTICVPVSARTGEGIDDLLEMILLDADVKELKSNPNRQARGIVIEAQLDRGRGPVATVLVQKGTLHVGDFVAVGSAYGKVRAMIDDKGRRVKEALPSTPVEILGLNDVPTGGETFISPKTEKEARSFAETFISEGRERMLEETKSRLTLDSLFSQIKEGNVKELNVIIKADVQGSVEAVKQSLTKLSNEEVVVKVIHNGVGAINESDVSLAQAAGAIIVGFNTKPDATAKAIAEREGVDVRLYSVIYKAIEEIENIMKGKLDPVFEEKVIGHATVRQTFKASGVGTIAGSFVMDGILQRGCSVRITREGTQIFEGPLASLKRFKDDVKEVKEGYECGLVFEKFNDVQVDDMIEAYTMVEVPR